MTPLFPFAIGLCIFAFLLCLYDARKHRVLENQYKKDAVETKDEKRREENGSS